MLSRNHDGAHGRVRDTLSDHRPIKDIETIASGRGIRERIRLRKPYGHLGWRKRKGYATIELRGWIGKVELRCYEAHGGGRFGFKIERILT